MKQFRHFFYTTALCSLYIYDGQGGHFFPFHIIRAFFFASAWDFHRTKSYLRFDTKCEKKEEEVLVFLSIYIDKLLYLTENLILIAWKQTKAECDKHSVCAPHIHISHDSRTVLTSLWHCNAKRMSSQCDSLSLEYLKKMICGVVISCYRHWTIDEKMILVPVCIYLH